jgi:hypothetical protein
MSLLAWYRRQEGYRLKNQKSYQRHHRRVHSARTIGFEKRTKSVEEPAMAIQLFLVLLLEAKQDLNRASTR